jgi:hypothetical protein
MSGIKLNLWIVVMPTVEITAEAPGACIIFALGSKIVKLVDPVSTVITRVTLTSVA